MSVGNLYSMRPAVTFRVVALRLQHFSIPSPDAVALHTQTFQRPGDDCQSWPSGKS